MRRYISLFLAILMALSALPVQIFADDATPIDDIYAIGDIEILEDDLPLAFDSSYEDTEGDAVEVTEAPVEDTPSLYITSVTYIGGGIVEASWSEVSGATHYKVYVAEKDSSVYKSVAVTQNIYCSFALENGTYKVRVKALVNDEWTALSDCPYYTVTATVASENPSIDDSDTEDITQHLGTCNGITASVCEYSLDLSWEAIDTASSYTVYFKRPTSFGYSDIITVYTASTTKAYYGDDYVIRIVANFENGETQVVGSVSIIDGVLSEFVDESEGSSGTVGSLTATVGATSTLVSWTPVSGATYYIVAYKLSTASSTTSVYDAAASITIPYGGTSSFTVEVRAIINSNLSLVGALTVTNGAIEGVTEEEPADPIAVSSKEDLNNVRNNLAASYYLTNDIIFTEEDFAEGGDYYNSGYGFLPIGMGSGTFSGTFDGNGYTISGLQMNLSSAASGLNGGLFASNTGTIKNLTVSGDISATGSSNNMGLICGNNAGVIENCQTNGSVFGVNAGGVTGYSTGTISNCINNATVTSTSTAGPYVGGIVGNGSGTITDCTNNGSVSASGGNYSYVGGIVGNGSGTITDCTNNGSVSTYGSYSAYAGGISANGGTIRTITNCSNSGTITAFSVSSGYSYAGGISASGGTITNCSNSGTITAFSDSSYGSSCAGGISASGATISDCCNTGKVGFDGTETTITRTYGSFTLVQTAASTTISWPDVEGATAYIIYINSNAYATYTASYTLTDIGFFDSFNIQSVYAYDNSTPIATISGYYSIPSVLSHTAGGIAATASTVSNSFNTGKVTASQYSGGIVGNNTKSIQNCYNAGEVCAVSGYTPYLGGLAGYNMGKLYTSYNAGSLPTIDETSTTIGAVAGYNDLQASILGCYYLESDVPAVGTGLGSGIELTASQLQNQSNLSGFDFDTVWTYDSTVGYVFPVLRSVTHTGATVTPAITVTFSEQYATVNWNAVEGATAYIVEYKEASASTSSTTYTTTTQITVTLGVNDSWSVEVKAIVDGTLVSVGSAAFGDATLPETENPFTSGSGTVSDPYIITTPEQLDMMRRNLSAHYKLGADIDLSEALFATDIDLSEHESYAYLQIQTAEGVDVEGSTIYLKDYASSLDGNLSLAIPVYALYGYMTPDYRIKLVLPTDYHYSDGTAVDHDVEWKIAVNGTEYALKSVPADCEDGYYTQYIYFGYVAHDYVNDDYWTVIPQSTLVNDLSSITLNSNIEYTVYLPWSPVGTVDAPFTGSFNGAGYTISGLGNALFGANSGYVSDLNVECDIEIKETDTTVGVIANDNSGTIARCFVSGKVDLNVTPSHDINVGLIAGTNSGVISICYVDVYATSYWWKLNQNDHICAVAFNTDGIISNVMFNSTVAGAVSDVLCYQSTGGSISNCYSYNPILVSSDSTTSVTNCYYAVGTDVSGATKVNLPDFANESTFEGFDFDNIWEFDETLIYRYPVLQNIGNNFEKHNDSLFASGSGTQDDPFIIETVAQLTNIAHYPTAYYFELANDIVLEDFEVYLIESDGLLSFSGHLNGNGHTITGIENGTLVTSNHGTIENLGLLDSDKSSVEPVFAYASLAYENYGVIKNCYNDSDRLCGENSWAGKSGLVYYNHGVIANCYNSASITANNSYVYAAGIAYYNDGTISNCYNTGNVISYYSRAGGICGINYGTITNCYNIGEVSEEAPDGMVAYEGSICAQNDGSVINCYYLDNCENGVGDGEDTAVKLTSDEMKQTQSFAGFDFDTVWKFNVDSDYAYPVLRCFNLGEHVHTFGEWTSLDGIYHTHSCACGESETAYHKYDSSDDTSCDSCGFEREINDSGATLTVNSVSANRGTTVELIINVSAEETADTIGISIGFDETILALDPDGSNWLLSNALMSDIDTENGYAVFTWENAEKINGDVLKLSLTVSEDAPFGETLVTFGAILQSDGTAVANVSQSSVITVECLHEFDSDCDQTCAVCLKVREVSHQFKNSCDTVCDSCGFIRRISSISIYQLPNNTIYWMNAREINVDGGIVLVEYENSASQYEDLSMFEISGFDSSSIGTKTITVSVGSLSATFEIEVRFLHGDLNGNDVVDSKDAIYLLYHSVFPEGYPLNQDSDFDLDGDVDRNDAIYLLYNTIFGDELYPLS